MLITHGPPHGFGDRCGGDGHRVGCDDLRVAIASREIAVSVAGHVHQGYGHTADDVTLYVNASTCTHSYRPTNPPVVFDAPPAAELRAATAAAVAARRAGAVARDETTHSGGEAADGRADGNSRRADFWA